MNLKFKMKDITHALGVAPATSERITGLLNGSIHPDHFKSLLDENPLSQFGDLIEHEKVMPCLAYLLHAKIKGKDPMYIDRGDDHVPTVILHEHSFLIMTPAEYSLRSVEEANTA